MMLHATLPAPLRPQRLTTFLSHRPQNVLYDSFGTPRYNALVYTSHALGYGYYSEDLVKYTWVESVLSDGMSYWPLPVCSQICVGNCSRSINYGYNSSTQHESKYAYRSKKSVSVQMPAHFVASALHKQQLGLRTK
jgi:hypothetical protein